MSNRALDWAFKQKLPSTQKLVLACLSWRFNEESGRCDPSQVRIAADTGLHKRSVIRALRSLESLGLIRATKRYDSLGEPISSSYDLLMKDTESPTQCHGVTYLKTESHLGGDSVSKRGDTESPKQEIKQGIEQEKNKPPRKRVAAGAYVPPDWIPGDSWQGFVEMRREIRAPLTDRAAQLTVRKLDELRASGQSPGTVLDQSVQRGWKGVFAVKPEGEESNGIRSRTEHNTAELERYRSGGDSLGEDALIFG